MGKRKFKNKVKNLISSFIITIFLLVSAYFGVDYFQEDLVSKNKDISKNETQEVTAQIDYTNSINLQNDKLRILWEVTPRCNMFCKHCLFYQSNEKSSVNLTYRIIL